MIYWGDGAAPDAALPYEEILIDHAPIADARRGGDALAGIYYTAGTTGLPKGVMLRCGS
jgi:long-subunit acyl-CoA synthetase (AMP-forming)